MGSGSGGVQQKINFIFKQTVIQKSIFKDKNVLDVNYIPQNILHRDREIVDLSKILSVSLKGEKPSNVFIYGPTGTGKTLVVDFVMNELINVSKEYSVNVYYVYVNSKLKRIADTEYRLISYIANSLGENIPFTGLPTDVVYERFLNVVDALDGVLIVVIDEIDYLVNKIGDKFLYTLTRINKNLSSNTVISIIGISNNLTFTEYLDARVRSSLSEEEIVFSPYNAIQLRDILNDRVSLAFHDGVVDNSVVSKCAAIAAQENGDARKALDLLRVAGEIAERNNESRVREYHVDLAQKKIDYDRFIEVIKSLANHQKIILYSILDLLLFGNTHKIYTGDVYDKYVSVCNVLKKSPISQRRVSDIINDLDLLGIVNAKIKNLGRYGRTREISLNNSKELYEKIYNLIKNDLYL